MKSVSSLRWAALAGRAVGVVGEVGERLVVELEERVGVPGERVVPAARVPGPRDVLVAQAVADGRAWSARARAGRCR